MPEELSADYIRESGQLTRNAQRLEYEEEQMRKSLRTFAESLKAIRDTGCWRVRGEPYKSFDDYCRQKLGFNKDRASQIITAGGTLKAIAEASRNDPEVAEIVSLLPERSARELKKVEPKKAARAIRKLKDSGQKITAASIIKTIEPDRIDKINSCRCPTCGSLISQKKRASIPD